MGSHLIVGNSEDYHAVAVKWALAEQGESAFIWDGIGSQPDGHLTIEPGTPPIGISLGGTDYGEFATVWYRRAVKHRDVLNVAEYTRDFIERELREAHGCLATTVSSMTEFVVGGEGVTKASSKSFQLYLAAKMGFNVPKTLITNDYDKVCRFIDENYPVAIKPFAPHHWHDAQSHNYRVASTTLIKNKDGLSPESTNVCPCIFQAYIDKKYELRVTVIGEHVFAARISKSSGGAFVDWRFHMQSDDVSVDVAQLGEEMEERITAYVNALGLKYGCIDLVVDQNDKIFFLEINPSGQFLFIEQMVPEFRLLSAFSSMLRAKSKRFELDSNKSINTNEFEKTDEFKLMMANAGKIVTSVPLHSEVS